MHVHVPTNNKYMELTCRNLCSGSMKREFESKSACRIMVDLLSDDADHTVDTIKKRQVDGSSCSSFNTKSTVASYFKKYGTAASAISKYTKMCSDTAPATANFTK